MPLIFASLLFKLIFAYLCVDNQNIQEHDDNGNDEYGDYDNDDNGDDDDDDEKTFSILAASFPHKLWLVASSEDSSSLMIMMIM